MQPNGFVELEFTFNASALKGQTLVVFESVYEDKIEVGTHADINDKDQTTYIPEIKTTATDKVNGGKELNAAEKQTIVDKVAYTNLCPGKEYTVKGTLMDKATGKPVMENGKEITAEKKFTPTKPDGFVELEFTVNTTSLKGQTLVVFERLYEDGKEVTSHTDINDVDQSVQIPNIKTKASFNDGNKNAKPSKNMTVTDIFTYENVVSGQKYLVEGKLINKATGKVVAKAEEKFTARSTKGDVKVKFNFDGSKLEGTELVVTEKLYSLLTEEKKLVASHEDINNMKQTVSIPKLRTTATDKTDGGKDLNAAEKQTIVDKVSYTNLYPGKEYTIKGVLMNKATGKPILDNGKKVTAEKTFVAKQSSGFVTLEFTFNASALKGQTIVVFEDLYEDKIEVGTHSDINDKDQSIYVPEIHTTATSKDDGSKSVLPIKKVTIVDKVEYKNLVIGKEYTVKGVLMDKETGEKLLVDGKEVTAETTFTAEEKNGFVEVIFEFDASVLIGS